MLDTNIKQYKLHFLAQFHYMSLCFMSCRSCAKECDHEKALADLTAHEDEHLGGYRLAHVLSYVVQLLCIQYCYLSVYCVLFCTLRRIYPRADRQDYYTKFFEQACPSLCTDTAASRARQEEIK